MDAKVTEKLARAYGLFVVAFALFILVMTVLEQLGVGAYTIGVLFVVATVFTYVAIGWRSRTMQVEAYFVAGRQVPAPFNGMAAAAGWLSGAVFIALAGGLFFGGYGYMAFIVGWTGGFVLVNSLMAPHLRKFGCYTVPDYIGTRYGGHLARVLAVVVLLVASFTYLTAQIDATGTVASRALGISHQHGVWFGLLAILMCSVLGGMRAVTWTQVAQYLVLIIAYLVPLIWMSNLQGLGIVPYFSYGEALQRIAQLEAELGLLPPAEPIAGLATLTTPHIQPAGDFAEWRFFALALCMMAGTASLPHLLMRYFTTPSVRSARKSVAWSLFFVLLLYLSAPALATLTKLQLLDPDLPTSIVGQPIEAVLALDWVRNWQNSGMLAIVDQNGDGMVQLNEIFMRSEIVMLAAPEIAGLPHVVSGLVAAGALAAAMAAASALLLSIGNALGHDLYHRIVDPRADTAVRLIVARFLLMLGGIAAASVASMQLTGMLGAVAWAFCFACSGLFFPLVLGIWWKRANWQGAVAGMAAGMVGGSLYLWWVYSGGTPLLGLDEYRFGIVGMFFSGAAMVAATLSTPEPDAEIRRMFDETHVPAGPTVLAAKN